MSLSTVDAPTSHALAVRSGRARVRIPIVVAPEVSARAAGLVHVDGTEPAYSRKRSGRGFTYLDEKGRALTDQEDLARIRHVAIPPAWTEVWICTHANGHLQATGRDARGRKQYRYHERWRVVRDETKFHRMLAFGHALPGVRARTREHLAESGLSRERVLATVVTLLETTLMRVGNDEYARENDSYGLTTLLDDHVEVRGARLRFHFRGKSGKEHAIEVRDRRMVRIIRSLTELPGKELFQYLDEEERRVRIHSEDVNEYLRIVAGAEFTAKDFRTWAGTKLAVDALAVLGGFDTQTEAKRLINEALDQVAERLGNTRAVCRRSYVHPAVLEAYFGGTLGEELERPASSEVEAKIVALEANEARVMRLLYARIAISAPPQTHSL
jgi:DNA topoisomerase I